MGRKPKMYYLLRPGSCSCFYIPGIHLHFYVISFLFVCFLKLEIQNIDFDFMLIADPSDSRLHGNRVETVKKKPDTLHSMDKIDASHFHSFPRTNVSFSHIYTETLQKW